MSDFDIYSLEQTALRLLVKREHSRWELRQKLKTGKASPGQIEQLLDELAEQDAQSDRRYAQEYIDFRRRRGFGPARIHLELSERGITPELVDELLDPDDEQWDQVLLATAKSKFGGNPPQGFRDWARRARFLEYRGFSPDTICRLLSK